MSCSSALTLKSTGQGAHIGNLFTGALGYADDVALVSSSIVAMDGMLQQCSLFAAEYGVKFNSLKSQSLLFSPRNRLGDPPVFSLSNESIPQVATAVHLGSNIGQGSDEANKTKASIDLGVAANRLRCSFFNTQLSVKKRLFQTYCSSFYGCPLWNLTKLEAVCVRWRQCVRALLGMPQRSHCWLLPLIMRAPPPDVELPRRFARFWQTCRSSHNPLVKAATELCCVSRTHAAENLRSVMADCRLGVDDVDADIAGMMRREWVESVSADRSVQAAICTELVDVMTGNLHCILTRYEASALLHNVST